MNKDNLKIENAKANSIINLTKKQTEGIKTAKQRFANKETYTCIAGYA